MSEGSHPRTALLGFSIAAMEGLQAANRPFVAVVPPGFDTHMEEHGLAYEVWDFDRLNEQSDQLAKRLTDRGVEVAVPLYEETVEWAGALNGRFRDDRRLFTRYLLFRDKAMMKRRAQMHGIRVGVFEEADDRDDVHRFFKRINKALIKLDEDVHDPVHLKPLAAAGSMGHRMLRSAEQIEEIRDDEFPCLLESHLEGQEFSCEVFVHAGKIRFLNINEYVHLGHSNFTPASPSLEASRPAIRDAVQSLIDAFEIEYGMIHPEFFITPDKKISFGEVAARVPGGHIFELIERAHGFNPFVGFAMCCDPKTTDEQLEAFFPDESEHDGFAGCLMVYPRQRVVKKVKLPENLLLEDYYEKHNLFVPITAKVAERVAYGDHYGTVFFRGPNAEVMRKLLKDYEHQDFYTGDDDPEPGPDGNAGQESAT